MNLYYINHNFRYEAEKLLRLFFPLEKINIPQVKYTVIKDSYNIKSIEKFLNYPMIIKPANGGSSIGIEKSPIKGNSGNTEYLLLGLKNNIEIINKNQIVNK